MKCTWVDCEDAATFPQIAKDGSRWAALCAKHDAEINAAMDDFNARKVLSNWVKAQGGAKKAADRMMGEK